MLNAYHVLLLYPQHIANYYGEAYLSDPILANNCDVATTIARRECAQSNEQPEDWAEDFQVLLIMKGGEPC